MSMLNTSVSGLLAAQRALAVTSHNISNVNTPGYSRQVVDLTAREPQFSGSGYIGNGVNLVDIRRVHDQFLATQVRNSSTSESEASAFLQLAHRIDNMLADERTGLTPGIQNFFNAVQDLANQPSSTSARQVMLSEAESLASRFQFIDARLSELANEIRASLDANINEVNSLAAAIGDINKRIVVALGQSGDELPNDLLDQRDKLIDDLSKLVAVSTVEQQDGAVNVFIGSGQPLVLGIRANTLSASETYRGHFDISLVDSFSSVNITDNISGGVLGGILNFQAQMLEPAHNSIGRLAIGLAQSFNTQHQLGRGLDGDLNTTFFDFGAPEISPLGSALNNVAATITDPDALTTSDYRLIYNGADNYSLVRLSDNQVTSINTGGVYPFTSVAVDGFTVDIAAVAGAVGDEYIIRPTINGARDLDVVLTDLRKIAAAAPLRGGEAGNAAGLPTNTGSGGISAVEITSTTGLPLVAPIALTFDSVGNQFIISAPPGGALAYDPATESGGKQFTIAAAGNATFTISGTPADGDQFIIENNVSAGGDNRNALQLSALQDAALMLNGTANYHGAYGQLIVEVGTLTRQTEISRVAFDSLLRQSIEARESVSGVNLDEEAANMLKFQQAYQAAAQIITVADTLFQTLINAVQ